MALLGDLKPIPGELHKLNLKKSAMEIIKVHFYNTYIHRLYA